MNITFKPDQPFQQIKPLNADFSRKLGQCVDLIRQQDHDFVLKYLSESANVVLKSSFSYELAMNAKLFDLGFSQLDQICDQVQFKQKCHADSDILILPYMTSIDFSSLNVEQSIEKFIKMAECVDNLHSLGFLHGDLKLKHFLSDAMGEIWLIDFAQSQSIQISATNLTSQTLNATPAYMAPELFHGSAKSVQSDIYALGVIFYEILIGQKPFQQQGKVLNSYQDWALAHCQQVIPLLPEALQCYQYALDHMLAKRLKNRADCIKTMISDLKISKK